MQLLEFFNGKALPYLPFLVFRDSKYTRGFYAPPIFTTSAPGSFSHHDFRLCHRRKKYELFKISQNLWLMAGGGRLRDSDITYLLLQEVLVLYIIQLTLLVACLAKFNTKKRKRGLGTIKYDIISRIPDQEKHLARIIGTNDMDCIANLRMDRRTFRRLCQVLRERGDLVDRKYVTVEEQLAMFLSVLAHHKKNKVVRFDFWRSGQTISRYIHVVLGAIMRLHELFLPKPVAVTEECTDPRWQWFKGCLGALDGTYIDVMVGSSDQPRYRTRKGQISTNVLGVCDRNLRFTYVLSGWEGSAADSRILRDAIRRPHGLKVPKGYYYLCDNGYANSDGFLTPFKGVRYHLKEWGPNSGRPQNKEELYNLRHSKARNVIERAFGILKMRWGILRSPTFYPIKTQNRLIMAAFLLHNFIRMEMPIDPVELQFDDLVQENQGFGNELEHEEYIDTVVNSPQWNASRDALAEAMWLQYSNGA